MNNVLQAVLLASLLVPVTSFSDSSNANILTQKTSAAYGDLATRTNSSQRGASHGPTTRGATKGGGGPDTLTYDSPDYTASITEKKESNPQVNSYMQCQELKYQKVDYFNQPLGDSGYKFKNVSMSPNSLKFILVNSIENSGFPVGWIEKVELPDTPYTQELISLMKENEESVDYKNCWMNENIKSNSKPAYDRLPKYRGVADRAANDLERKIKSEDSQSAYNKLNSLFGLEPAYFLPKNSEKWGTIYLTIEQKSLSKVVKTPNISEDEFTKSLNSFKSKPLSDQLIGVTTIVPSIALHGQFLAKFKNQFPVGIYKLVVNGVENSMRVVIQESRAWLADDTLLDNECALKLETDSQLDSGDYSATTYFYGNVQPDTNNQSTIIKSNISSNFTSFAKERDSVLLLAYTELSLSDDGAVTGSDRCIDKDYTTTSFSSK